MTKRLTCPVCGWPMNEWLYKQHVHICKRTQLKTREPEPETSIETPGGPVEVIRND